MDQRFLPFFGVILMPFFDVEIVTFFVAKMPMMGSPPHPRLQERASLPGVGDYRKGRRFSVMTTAPTTIRSTSSRRGDTAPRATDMTRTRMRAASQGWRRA